MPELLAEAAKVVSERQSIHGRPAFGHGQLGRTWSALLSEHFQEQVEPLPAHLVELMLAALKLHRASRPMKRSDDDYVDAINYINFAAQDSKEFTYGVTPPASD